MVRCVFLVVLVLLIVACLSLIVRCLFDVCGLTFDVDCLLSVGCCVSCVLLYV